MRSRRFTKQIELWGATSVSDGFGGNTVSKSKITDIWADLSTLDRLKYSNRDNGEIDFSNSVGVTIRENPNLSIDYKNNFIVYMGEEYYFTDRPVVRDFQKGFVTFIMLRNNDV